MANRHLMSGGRYPVLRALALMYLIGAGLTVLAGIATMIWSLVRAPANTYDRIVVSLGILAGTFFLTVSMLAIAEVLKLFMDIEHNSRLAAMNGASSNGNDATISSATSVSSTNRLAQLDEETAEGALIRGR